VRVIKKTTPKGILEVERAKIFVARTDTVSFKLRPGTKRGSDLNQALIFWPELLLVCFFVYEVKFSSADPTEARTLARSTSKVFSILKDSNSKISLYCCRPADALERPTGIFRPLYHPPYTRPNRRPLCTPTLNPTVKPFEETTIKFLVRGGGRKGLSSRFPLLLPTR